MPRARTRATLCILLLALAMSLGACRNLDVPKVPGVTPYRIVIQQGNFISQEMVSQLKPGMSREQVRFVLGTPLVSDIFHADRWDYVYFLEHPNGRREQRNLAVIFQDGKLARVVGDLMPAEGAKPAAAGFPSQAPEPPKPAAAAKPPAEAKPAAPAPQPPAEAAKPDTVPNWRAASEAPPAAATPSPEPSPPPAAAEEKKEERGFFGRLLYRFKPGESPPIKSDVPTKPEAIPESQPEPPKPEPAQETAKEEKPSEESEKGFFGRLREKIGL